MVKKLITELINRSKGTTPYSIQDSNILFNEEWCFSLKSNYRIVKDFIQRNLITYLTNANPNVIDISSKLERPQSRNLSNQRNLFNEYLSASNSYYCLYSNETLSSIESIDHFIPWSNVVHDHIWNLIPVTKSANSSKSDCLPSFDAYLEPFIKFQYNLANYIYESNSSYKKWYFSILQSETLPDTDTFRNKYIDVL